MAATQAEPVHEPQDLTTVLQAPWVQPVWQRFLALSRGERVPHALMLVGEPGLGLRPLALMMAGQLLCDAPTEEGPCGHCPSCRQWRAGAHPDLNRLLVEPDTNSLKIEAIRRLIDAFALTRRGRHRVAVIEQAERMTDQAANALLKTLEEPPAGGVLILTTQRADRLPATIRSRVQRLAVAEPSRATVVDWLTQQHGLAPDEAALCWFLGDDRLYLGAVPEWDWRTATEGWVALAEGSASPLAVAQQWQKLDANELGAWLLRLWTEVARRQAGLDSQAPDMLQPAIGRLASKLPPAQLQRCHRILLEFAQQAGHPLNRPLALERLAIDLVDDQLPARLA